MGLSDLTNRQIGLIWFLLGFIGFLLGMLGSLLGFHLDFWGFAGLLLILAVAPLRIPSVWTKSEEIRLWFRFISNSAFVFGVDATLGWILIYIIVFSPCVNGEC